MGITQKVAVSIPCLPVSTNRLYGISSQGRKYVTPAMRANKEEIGWEVLSKYNKGPLEGDLRVEISVFWPDKRRRDVDNTKGMVDALTGILWEDDSQIVELRQRKFVDRKNPRTEICVEVVR